MEERSSTGGWGATPVRAQRLRRFSDALSALGPNRGFIVSRFRNVKQPPVFHPLVSMKCTLPSTFGAGVTISPCTSVRTFLTVPE